MWDQLPVYKAKTFLKDKWVTIFRSVKLILLSEHNTQRNYLNLVSIYYGYTLRGSKGPGKLSAFSKIIWWSLWKLIPLSEHKTNTICKVDLITVLVSCSEYPRDKTFLLRPVLRQKWWWKVVPLKLFIQWHHFSPSSLSQNWSQ